MFSYVYNEAVYSNSLNLLLLSFLSFQMEVKQSYNFFTPKGYHITILLQTVLLQHEKVHSQLISKVQLRSNMFPLPKITYIVIFSGLFVILLISYTFVFIPRGNLAQV